MGGAYNKNVGENTSRESVLEHCYIDVSQRYTTSSMGGKSETVNCELKQGCGE